MITYSLSQILEILTKGQKTLFAGFDFFFTAELHKVSYTEKYMYCELIEVDEEKKIKAKIKGTIFDMSHLTTFCQKTGKNSDELEGLTLLMKGNFNFHIQYGTSIVISHISTEYTLGQVNQQKGEIIKKLEKEGILLQNKRLAKAVPPYKIAIITGENSEGANDFTSILEQSQYNFSYTYFFSKIHGSEAANAVCEQIEKIEKTQKEFTHVIIVRGGGESSGMLRGNNEILARKICGLSIPVIIAIGHTSDTTVLDTIANTVAKTPSDAAHLLINECEQWEEKMKHIMHSIYHKSLALTGKYRKRIDTLQETITTATIGKIKSIRQLLEVYYKSICSQGPETITQKGYALVKMNKKILGQKDIKNIQIKDKLTIDIYGYSITVEVLENIKKI